jgi:cellulose 1,4-beta-cellobiosidase
MTSHVCKDAGLFACKDDVNCGRGNGNRYKGRCDMDGADSNPFRLGDEQFFQPGSQFKIDTRLPFTVKTAFITDNGQETGNLIEIKRTYVQNGKTVIGGSLTDSIVADTKKKFNEFNYQAQLGGLKKMGEAFKRKMVFVISIWDDSSEAHMLWLDGVYPRNSTSPGAKRGPCPADSGDPERMRR